MAGEKEIRGKIRSVKNMQKITKAMEMVAASKIRKAQLQMEASRPYAERIRRVVGHLAHANPDYKHPFLVEREVKRVGYIVISTDRGLCGGLNVNMFKTVIGELSKWQSEDVEVDLEVTGGLDRLFDPVPAVPVVAPIPVEVLEVDRIDRVVVALHPVGVQRPHGDAALPVVPDEQLQVREQRTVLLGA